MDGWMDVHFGLCEFIKKVPVLALKFHVWFWPPPGLNQTPSHIRIIRMNCIFRIRMANPNEHPPTNLKRWTCYKKTKYQYPHTVLKMHLYQHNTKIQMRGTRLLGRLEGQVGGGIIHSGSGGSWKHLVRMQGDTLICTNIYCGRELSMN